MTPLRHEGEPVWIGQISRDIGVRFTRKTITTHKIDPDVDEAMYALIEDLVMSQQISKIGYVKGTRRASRAKPRHNLTGDPYFTDGYRTVLVFDRRPHSFTEIQFFDNWEGGPVADSLDRLIIE